MAARRLAPRIPSLLRFATLLGAAVLLFSSAPTASIASASQWAGQEVDVAAAGLVAMTADAAGRGGDGAQAGLTATGADDEFVRTAAATRRRLQDGGWQLNAGCYRSQSCSLYDGTCLSATTLTSSTGCGSAKQESVVEYASSNCRNTGCSWGGCNSDEIEVSNSWCWWAYDERCCKKAYTYTCRAYLACTWVQPRNLGVFASGGAWSASATTDTKTNAYTAAILNNYMYEESLGVSGVSAFSNAFATRVASRMGATRLWVYYYLQDTEWLFLETPTSLIVVARGTEGLLSTDAVVTDLGSLFTTSVTDFGGVGVSIGYGFGQAYNANKAYFLSELARFKATSSNPSKPLWFTGHSLGGALATLFAAYTKVSGHPVQGVITFGSPIVGNEAFRAAYPLNARTYRYEAKDDPVVVLPPTFSTTSHVGTQAYLVPCTAAATAIGSGRRLLLGEGDDATTSTTGATEAGAKTAFGAVAAEAATAAGSSSAAAGASTTAGDAGTDGVTRFGRRGGSGNSSVGTSSSILRPSRRNCGVWQMNGLQNGDKAPKTKGKATDDKPQRDTFTCPAAPASPGGSEGGKKGGGKKREDDDTADTRGSGLTAAHSILTSYTADIYYCYLSATEAATVPAYLSITAL